ncbi:MAG: hemolysin family protein [Ruminococcus sp.]|nr:hemolysin family protein [Ruminococcus sp.]
MVNIVLIVVLTLCSAFFSCSETAFSSISKARLKNYVSQGNKRAKIALDIADNYDKALTTILIGNNIVNIASSSLATVVFTQMLGASGVGVSTIVMTIIVLIFGEITPKTFANENAEKCAIAFAPIISFLMFLFTPVVWLFSQLKKLLGKFYKQSDSPSVTEDELKYIIEEIEEQGVLEEQEGDLVRSALDFDEITVNEILTPRVKVVGVDIDTPIDEVKEIFLTEMYSRLPVYEDTIDNIVGVVNQKDFFYMQNKGKTNLSEIVQEVLHISELKLISEALKEMQLAKSHMAIVMDQYGGTKGIITLEDILEQLVGEIYDENDEVEAPISEVSKSSYEISGELTIYELLKYLELPDDYIQTNATTVNGWITEIFGHIPTENETIYTNNGWFIKVISTKNHHVKEVNITIPIVSTEDDSNKE